MNPTLLWLVIGAILCLMELFLPTAFIEFAMGISALLVALVAIVVPYFGLQVVIWMGLSVGLVVLTRRFLPKRRITGIEDSQQGKTLTAIPKGETGRVQYEGNSWQARCNDSEIEIEANQPVYVIGREGNTLIVVPERLLRS